jgi:energy-coupling factor transporter transmembrane protein EcfT
MMLIGLWMLPVVILFSMAYLIYFSEILFIAGLLLFAGFYIKWKHSRLLMGIGLGLFPVIIILQMGTFVEFWPEKIAEVSTKSSVHDIQRALLSYASDHDGLYPEDISEIVPEYLDAWPENAFTTEPMKEIDFGSEPFQGDFTYVPVYSDSNISGFYILGYGIESNPGIDLYDDGTGDHVIIIIQSDEEYDLDQLRDILKE